MTLDPYSSNILDLWKTKRAPLAPTILKAPKAIPLFFVFLRVKFERYAAATSSRYNIYIRTENSMKEREGFSKCSSARVRSEGEKRKKKKKGVR